MLNGDEVKDVGCFVVFVYLIIVPLVFALSAGILYGCWHLLVLAFPAVYHLNYFQCVVVTLIGSWVRGMVKSE